jgi:xanthine/uracil/vitamin C permease (AzgA family)
MIFLPESWDMPAVLTIVFVMFTVVISTVLSVGVVKSMIMRQTKQEIVEGIRKISRKIDFDEQNRQKTRCK